MYSRIRRCAAPGGQTDRSGPGHAGPDSSASIPHCLSTPNRSPWPRSAPMVLQWVPDARRAVADIPTPFHYIADRWHRCCKTRKRKVKKNCRGIYQFGGPANNAFKGKSMPNFPGLLFFYKKKYIFLDF